MFYCECSLLSQSLLSNDSANERNAKFTLAFYRECSLLSQSLPSNDSANERNAKFTLAFYRECSLLSQSLLCKFNKMFSHTKQIMRQIFFKHEKKKDFHCSLQNIQASLILFCPFVTIFADVYRIKHTKNTTLLIKT